MSQCLTHSTTADAALSPLLSTYYIRRNTAAAAAAADRGAAATLRLTQGGKIGKLVRITGCWTTRKICAICPPTVHYNLTN